MKRGYLLLFLIFLVLACTTVSVSSFEECVNAGYEVVYPNCKGCPPVCTTPSGLTFSQEVNNSIVGDSAQLISVEVVDCGEWIDLFSSTANITVEGDGFLTLGFFNLFRESNTNITNLVFNGSSFTGGLIGGGDDSYFTIPVTNLPVEDFSSQVLINYSNKGDSYFSVCSFNLYEENYYFFDEVLPGSEDYVPSFVFSNPLNISNVNPGPNGCSNLEACVNYCSLTFSVECEDWIHSIYSSLNVSNQVIVNDKFNGVWLPTIDSVRAAVKLIPVLKSSGVNIVSFGPDIVTRDVDSPISVGDNLFKFYVRVFEDSGFNVHLVPNSMHWGNNEGFLEDFNSVVLKWAGISEELNTEFFTVLNEVDGHDTSMQGTSDWLQSIIPLVKNKYSGLVCAQPTQSAFYTGESLILNYSGYDCITPFFSLLTYGWGEEHFIEDGDLFIEQSKSVLDEFDSVKYVIPTDVAAFRGGNWAEDSIICMELEHEGIYSNHTQHYNLFDFFFSNVYPSVNGSFLNNWMGFTWTGNPVENVVKDYYTSEVSVLESKWSDDLWNTTGLLELFESVMMTESDKLKIFDLNVYTPGYAGLSYEPCVETPGPFNCVSVEECMEYYRSNPEEYLKQNGRCSNED